MVDGKKKDILEPLNNASPEIQNIIIRVLRLEKEKLYQQRPHVKADILKIIKEEIK